jgi:hypothetical protein
MDRNVRFSTDKTQAYWIWGFHSSYNENYHFMGYDTVYSGRFSPTFRRNVSRPSSEPKSKPRHYSTRCRTQILALLAASFACSSTLKMEAVHSSDTSVNFSLHAVTVRYGLNFHGVWLFPRGWELWALSNRKKFGFIRVVCDPGRPSSREWYRKYRNLVALSLSTR